MTDWVFDFSKANTIPSLGQQVIEQIFPISLRPSTKTISRWYQDFKERGFNGWNLSLKGHYTRLDFLSKIPIGTKTIGDELKILFAVENDL